MRSIVIAAVVLTGGLAHADEPITDRTYAIDFYDGVAIGSTARVGMGGAGAALITGTAGVLINPAQIGVRNTTDNDTWGWDYHLDYLSSIASKDYDNNGTTSDSGAQFLTLGIGGRKDTWALAVTATLQSSPIESDPGMADLDAVALRTRVALAKWFPAWDLSVGLGFQNVQFQIAPEDGDALFSINGTGAIGGITWAPHGRSFRWAAALETPIRGTTVEVSDACDPEDCQGYILPEKVASPAKLVVGFAHRFARTDWNQQVTTSKFRDELAITTTTDLVVTAPSDNAYGIEAFGKKMLQRSGEDASISLRLGTEIELVPGRFRLRGGTYWEPGRFENVSGRLHGTFGFELRVFEENVWGPRRGRISFTGDVAERYRNIAVSVGFWH